MSALQGRWRNAKSRQRLLESMIIIAQLGDPYASSLYHESSTAGKEPIMSGPIVRQYGVPNWDEIFGKKEDSAASTNNQTEPNATERINEPSTPRQTPADSPESNSPP